MTEARPDIPAQMKRTVRKRCGFGCVVCGVPIFHYDHMDDYADVKVHEEHNITLLCPNHHQDKTSRRLSLLAIKSANEKPFNINNTSTSPYRWLFTSTKVKFFLGGNTYYFDFLKPPGNFFDAINIHGRSFLGVGYDGSGLVLNAILTDKDGKEILVIDEGEMKISTGVFDYNIEGPLITIRSAVGSIELLLRFEEDGLTIERGQFVRGNVSLTMTPGAQALTANGQRQVTFIGNTFGQSPGGILIN